MSDTTIRFNAPGADGQTTYNEASFQFSTGDLGFDRASSTDSAIGNYVVPIASSATVVLGSTNGKTFGLSSIAFDGIQNDPTSGSVETGRGAVVITFTGFSAALNRSLTPFSITTDALPGFETFSAIIPIEYRSGLVSVSWSTRAEDPEVLNAWAAFDNVVLSTNTAPTTDGTVIYDPATPGSGVTGTLPGDDDDLGDTLKFQQSTDVKGVSVSSDGTFIVARTAADDDVLPGEFREVKFSYTVTDGFETSAPREVTVQLYALRQGDDIRVGKGNHPQELVGTEAGEWLFGGNQHDTLSGNGGADTLSGQNGNDGLDGGKGRDKLLGGNGSDTLDGGLGDDILTGGKGSDEFYFGAGWGHDVITDFDPKTEHIHLVPSGKLGDWSHVNDWMKVVDNDVLIQDGAGNTLLLLNTKISSLAVDDFLFG